MVSRVAVIGVSVLLSATLAGVPASASGHRSPGKIVHSERLPRSLWLPGTGQAYRVKYWTKDVHGKSAVSSGAVFLPRGRPPQGGWPVISWAHGTVGVGDACAPSTAGRSERDIKYLKRWMAEGYAIVATDYQGLGTAGVHPYGDGRTEAYNIADMVRAGRHVARDLSKKWVVIGQSQGGHAALFAMSVAPRYASELDFRGGVATGAPSNIEPLAPLAGPYFPKLPLNGLVSYFGYYMAGLRASRPDVNVDKFLTPVGRSVVDDAERMCYDEMHDRVDGVGIGDMLAKPLFEARFYQATRDALQVPLKGYTRPFFLAHGMLDLDVPVPLTMKLAADLKANKVPVTFKTYPGADHSGNMFASLPDTVPFVAKLFSGKASVG